MKLQKWMGAVAAAFTLAVGGQAAAQTSVALELALVVDTSGSIDAGEYALQVNGYKAAFQNAGIQAQIASFAGSGGIAVSFIEWSGGTEQATRIGWTQLTSAADANAFAALLDAAFIAARPYTGLTAPGSAIQYATSSIFNNTYTSNRQVIDVSGDGSQNDGINTLNARNASLAAGVDAINGLAILGSEAGLDTWYQNNIVGGTGAFLEIAAGFNDFADAVARKIGRELTVPEPGTLALVGLALLGIGASRRRTAA